MKFTLSWLGDHLDSTASLDEICARLPMLGLEVESVEDRARDLAPFIVGLVVDARPHPDADRLRLCEVDTGTERVQVVCGAPNARTGMKGVFAPAGVTIPGTGLALRKSTIRGQVSNGMLCSEREMGLSDEHDGIIELPDDAPVGAPFAMVAGLDDPVIEVAITPDRADCLGVRGIARDLAAAGLGSLKPLRCDPVAGSFTSPIAWRVELPRADLAPFVVGRCFRGVRNGPSPGWLCERLQAIGLRPISALVDITNYVMMDLGRPLHAYDADRVDGDIFIRMARPGESYTALDGHTYRFDEDMIVIGDNHGVDDLAGIMGGMRTGCGPDTCTMFLEAALFDPVTTAATGRKLGILSDARYRFERGLDPTSPLWGTEVATRLILEICGGEASDLVVHGSEPAWQRTCTLRQDRTRSLTGVEVSIDDAGRILTDLGFGVTRSGGDLVCSVPPWRGDIDGEADLVEEVVRIHGYDQIPATSLRGLETVPAPALTESQSKIGLARRILASRGMMEAVTFSFVSSRLAECFGGTDTELRLINPISADLDVMRPSLLPNLLSAAVRNSNMAETDLALFEVGPQYDDPTPHGQVEVAAGIRTGQVSDRDWTRSARPCDLFDAKADALALLEDLGAPVANLEVSRDAPRWYHPGRAGCLRLGASVLARFGEVHPRILQTFDLRGPVVAFEVMLDMLRPPRRKGPARRALSLSPFQPVTRDFAFIVDKSVPAAAVLRAVRAADRNLITAVSLFDDYVGEGIPEETRSLAVAVTLQPRNATLNEDDLQTVTNRIESRVSRDTGGTLRRG